VIAEVAQPDLSTWWAPGLAFAAGVVSFASPCVLPLVPGYLAFASGAGHSRAPRRRAVAPILLFILGFTLVFTIAFGFAASSASRWLRLPVGQRVAGAVVLVFGAVMILYALRAGTPWLYREERPLLSRVRPGPAGALPLGMAFAIGWTPCIGPVLGGILALAAAQGTTARSVILLLLYSLGLGLPILLLGLGVRRATVASRFVARHYRWLSGIGGSAMAAIGILLISGQWVRLLSPLLRAVNRFTPPI
jgi:cytochrome c-type biogenesis protein